MQVARFSCGRRDPRRMQLAGPLRARSFAPGSGLPRSSPCVAPLYAGGTLFLWEARPAAEAACRPAQSQKLRPGVGAPTKAARAKHCLMQGHAFLVGDATRGECSLPARSKPKTSPRGRGSHEAARAWRLLMQVARFFCGRRDPRRMQLSSPLKARSFAPRSGLPRSSPCVAPLCAAWATPPACRAVAGNRGHADRSAPATDFPAG